MREYDLFSLRDKLNNLDINVIRDTWRDGELWASGLSDIYKLSEDDITEYVVGEKIKIDKEIFTIISLYENTKLPKVVMYDENISNISWNKAMKLYIPDDFKYIPSINDFLEIKDNLKKVFSTIPEIINESNKQNGVWSRSLFTSTSKDERFAYYFNVYTQESYLVLKELESPVMNTVFFKKLRNI